jgi:hypothetical protein
MSQKFNEIQQRYLLCLCSIFLVLRGAKLKGYSLLTAYYVALCNLEIMVHMFLVFECYTSYGSEHCHVPLSHQKLNVRTL